MKTIAKKKNICDVDRPVHCRVREAGLPTQSQTNQARWKTQAGDPLNLSSD